MAEYFDKNGCTHKDDGPAYVSDCIDVWYRHGLIHRLDGPAVIYKGSELYEYWILGHKHSEKEFHEKLKSYTIPEYFNELQ